MARKNGIWVVSDTYYPDEAGTSYYTTRLAEGLAKEYPGSVKVLCGFPIYNARGMAVPARETLHGVCIKRVRSTSFDKDTILLRVFNLVSVSVSIFFHALSDFRREDIVLVVTSPPSLPFVVAVACFLRGARCVFRIDDVYPEGIVATGYAKPSSPLIRTLMSLSRPMHMKADRIVVLGRDMARLVARNKLNGSHERIEIIPNWAETDLVSPLPKEENRLIRDLHLDRKFVVQCAGNMGRAQNIENIFGAAELLVHEEEIHFLFIGSGSKMKWMENRKANRGLRNITILGQLPRLEQPVFLNACDIAIVSLLRDMTGIGVPSRMYNIMAAGKPIVVIAAEDAEPALVAKEEGIGWVVEPDQPAKLAEIVLNARRNMEETRQMGNRARRVAESKYAEERILGRYYELIESIWGIAD